LHTAYIFGTLGNLGDCLGFGWSVEDAYAWTVGTSSELTLPLPGDDLTYVIRCDISPAVFADAVPRQRLTVYADDTLLGDFELAARTIIEIPLPAELTRGANAVNLTLLHPDAARPCDHGGSGDKRVLALCFSSAALVESRSADAGANQAAVHGIIAGGPTARRIAEVAGKLTSLRGRVVARFVNLDLDANAQVSRVEAPLRFCWLDTSAGTQATRAALFNRLPEGCTLRTFYTPAIRALWPFEAQDERSKPEPPLYYPSRYPHADRHAVALAGMNMPDEVLYTMYEMAADRDAVDLDGLFAEDLKRWQAFDRRTDVKLTGFLESRIGSSRLFMSPNGPGPDLLRAIVDRIIFNLPGFAVDDPDALAAELDFLLDGYAGERNELPVHKRVAEHFKLSWWSPDLKYRWENNLRTYRQHVLDTARWARWLP
jgi:hypothetical protein